MKRILIVEDNTLIRRALKEALSGEDIELLEGENGKQALQKFEENHFDLLILDIKMPDMDGLEVLRKIRVRNKELPIIIITAYKGLSKDPEVALGNVADFITKPIDIEILRAKVTEILGRESFKNALMMSPVGEVRYVNNINKENRS